MTEDTVVTAAEIARLAGVGRAAVSNWRRRFEDFPAPVGGSETSPTFSLADIQVWLREQGKLAELTTLETVWRQLERAAGDRTIVQALTSAGRYLTKRPGRPDVAPETRQALDALAAEEGASQAFEHLCGRLITANLRQFPATPPELAHLMIELAGPLRGAVLDPACGTGTILHEAVAVGGRQLRVFGQELDSPLADLAAVRLALHGADARVRTGNALRDDAFPELAVDAVICNPPFNERNWGFDELTYDQRWAYGMPPKGESELAWVQHSLAHLRPGGCAVLLMPPSVAARRPGRGIRAELVRQGVLRAVIALPAGAAPPLGVPLHLWVLRRSTEPAATTGLLLVDTTSGASVRLDDVGWPLVTSRALTPWRLVNRAPNEVGEETGTYKLVPTIDLLDDEVDLSPARWLRTRTEIADLGDIRESLAGLLERLPNLLPKASQVRRSDGSRATTTIAALAKSGALSLHHQTAAVETLDEGVGPAVLTTSDVVAGWGPSARLAHDDASPDQVILRVGDVVVPAAAPQPVATVVSEDGAILGPQLLLVRVDRRQLDPWFLAGFLRSRATPRSAGLTSSTRRLDMRKVEIPRLPLAEQRRYGEAFRRVAEFDNALRQAGQLGAEFAQSVTDGLAIGAVSPDELLSE